VQFGSYERHANSEKSTSASNEFLDHAGSLRRLAHQEPSMLTKDNRNRGKFRMHGAFWMLVIAIASSAFGYFVVASVLAG
jgi:hypothetical protein